MLFTTKHLQDQLTTNKCNVIFLQITRAVHRVA